MLPPRTAIHTWHLSGMLEMIYGGGVVLLCLFPKCLLPYCLLPNWLLLLCLLCQIVSSKNVYSAWSWHFRLILYRFLYAFVFRTQVDICKCKFANCNDADQDRQNFRADLIQKVWYAECIWFYLAPKYVPNIPNVIIHWKFLILSSPDLKAVGCFKCPGPGCEVYSKKVNKITYLYLKKYYNNYYYYQIQKQTFWGIVILAQ